MNNELLKELKNKGADIVKFVDISGLPVTIRREFNNAVLIGLLLSPEYIRHITKENIINHSEFNQKEHDADGLAEWAAGFIIAKGYQAFAQSEESNYSNGYFDSKTKSSILPHKTIALFSGIGWIGKNNLLVTKEYGCAFCMCTVLTNAPLIAENWQIKESQCGDCQLCKDICPKQVIHGRAWSYTTGRDDIVDVFHCECCLKCLAYCLWTQRYMKLAVFWR